MHTIEIDEPTYRFLQAKAHAFVETPGDTIKRLLDIDGNGIGLPADTAHSTNLSNIGIKRKKRKTNLPELIRSGLLRNGQKLTFRDYKGNRYPEYDVVLLGADLIWKKDPYSMSDLARILLKEKGHTNEFVRGPIFWVTEEGMTIAEIWDKYLKNNK